MIERLNGLLRRIPAWSLYLGMTLWALGFFLYGAMGNLGPDPARVIEHQYGQVALYLLVIGLAITPLRRLVGINALKFRRALGIMAAILVIGHFSVWLLLDVQSLEKALAELVKRRHLIFGIIAVILILPLLATSNNLAVRKMRDGWRKLHSLTYIIVPLAATHYILSTKTIEPAAAILMGVTVALLGLRLYWTLKRRWPNGFAPPKAQKRI